MSDGPVIYGRFDINWCEECNIPIFKERCGKCGNSTEKIELTPPGDVGPSFNENLVRDIVEENFGIDGDEFFPKNQVKLMNPVPGVDDAYELVVDGMILGQIRFEPDEKKWRLVLNMEGAIRIYLLGTDKKIVKMHESASEYLKDGANALSPGVTDADPKITPGDECIVVEEKGERTPSKVLGTGLAKMDGSEMVEKDYGTSVSTRGQKEVDYKTPEKSGTWEDVIEANENHLKEIEKESIDFIKETRKNQDLPIYVSFSGGKDSLAVLLLVRNALEKSEYKIIYNDTGIEFPETTEYIHELEKEIDKEIEIAEGKDPFWNNIEDFGPPGKDYRWCCKTCKLGPIGKHIDERYDGEDKILTFGGGRKFESDSRSKRDRVSKNPWVPGQISGMPIQNWRSLEVWLYIYQNDLPHNELYDKLERIGCWVCPSSSLAELETLKEDHPDLWEKFRTHLEEFAQKRNLPKEWIEYGFWRWKDLPSSQKDMADKLGLDSSELESKRYEEEIFVKKQKEDRWILEGNISLEDFERVSPILGKHEVDEDENGNKVYKFDNGLKISKNTIEGSMSQRNEGLLALKKAHECVECRSCQAICSQSAIHFDDEKIIVDDSCVGCRDCFDNCPLKFKT